MERDGGEAAAAHGARQDQRRREARARIHSRRDRRLHPLSARLLLHLCDAAPQNRLHRRELHLRHLGDPPAEREPPKPGWQRVDVAQPVVQPESRRRSRGAISRALPLHRPHEGLLLQLLVRHHAHAAVQHDERALRAVRDVHMELVLDPGTNAIPESRSCGRLGDPDRARQLRAAQVLGLWTPDQRHPARATFSPLCRHAVLETWRCGHGKSCERCGNRADH